MGKRIKSILQKMNTNHFEDLEPSSKHASSEKGRRITQQQQWRQQRRQEEEKAQEKTFQLPPIAAGSTVADNEDRYDSMSLPVTSTHLLELLDAKNIASLTPAGVSRLIDRALFSRYITFSPDITDCDVATNISLPAYSIDLD